MKGRNDAHQLQIELGISFYHGYTVAKCEGFADSLGISAAEFTRRLGSLLTPTPEIRGPLGLPDSLQVLRSETGARSQSMEPLALDDGSRHGARGARTLPGGAGKEDSAHQALTKGEKVSASQKAHWAGLSEMERAQKTLDRYTAIKHKTPAQKKAIATLRAKLAGKGSHTSYAKQYPDKQAIYLARAKAKRAGLPPPPLPGHEAPVPGESANERRKRLDRENHKRKRDAERQNATQHSGGKSWGGMNLAQRQTEMKRRMEVARQNKLKKSAPTYVNAGAQDKVRQAPPEAASA